MVDFYRAMETVRRLTEAVHLLASGEFDSAQFEEIAVQAVAVGNKFLNDAGHEPVSGPPDVEDWIVQTS